MIIATLGLALAAILLVKVGHWTKVQAADRGAMSDQWLAAHNSSQHASSQ